MKRIGYLVAKRMFDIIVSLLGTVICLIPWCFISVLIRIKSPGPVIYKAKRVGKDGKSFTLYKFRSMRVDSGEKHITTLRGDSRIFPFGQFLRDSKLDETPQLLNVLKGDMSVIGPRPEDEENAEQIYVGEYKEILSIQPGLSSPASLFDYTHGEMYGSEEDYIRRFIPLKLKMEMYYVTKRSFRYDMKVIFRTMKVIVQKMIGKKTFEYPEEYFKIEK